MIYLLSYNVKNLMFNIFLNKIKKFVSKITHLMKRFGNFSFNKIRKPYLTVIYLVEIGTYYDVTS